MEAWATFIGSNSNEIVIILSGVCRKNVLDGLLDMLVYTLKLFLTNVEEVDHEDHE